MEKKITCIICPKGCAMTAKMENGKVTVEGFTCPKGEEYAINECTNPVRTVTACVRVSNRENTMVSVKTETPVPKGKMMDVIAMLHKVSVEAPAKIGDVVLADAFGSRVVVTKDIA